MMFDGHAKIPQCIVGTIEQYAIALQRAADLYGSAEGSFNSRELHAVRHGSIHDILNQYAKVTA